MKLGRALVLVFALPALGAAGCDRAPSATGLPEWKPGDHDQEMTGGGTANGQQAPPPKSSGGGPRAGVSPVDVAWQQACATCHGMGGHGDGPSGPMVNAPDLTRADFQDRASDDDIAAVIANGRNKMPKFGLSEPVVKGLVAKIRSLRGR
jgi:hypothetical protein